MENAFCFPPFHSPIFLSATSEPRSVDHGWVPTKMGGKGAPDDLKKGYETQVWLSISDEAAARVSGQLLSP